MADPNKKPTPPRPRPARNRGHLLFEFDMQRQASQNEREYFVGAAYSPSSKALSDLEPITLADLRIDEHHRGKVLYARTVDDGVRAAAIQTIIEDGAGEVERLAVYNAAALPEAGDLLREGTVVAVKEPFFEEAGRAGSFCVRVDQPSDVLILTAVDERVPVALREKETKGEVSAAEWKARGNQFYKTEKFTDAVRAFSHGVDVSEESDHRTKCDILRNRAIANTYLRRFENALADAKAAVINSGDESTDEQTRALNAKALFRAGRAAYELRNFKEAKQLFTRARELAPQDEDMARELQRTEQRLQEESTGNHDFVKMNEVVSKKRNRLDHADFVAKTVKRDAGDRGRGLFAKQAIAPGELILCEKAFAVAFDSDERAANFTILDSASQRQSSGATTALLFNVVAKMLHNPSKAHEFFELHDGDDGGYVFRPRVGVADGVAAIDTFRAQEVLAYNAYGCPTVKTSSKAAQRQVKSPEGYPSTGIWTTISFINHACNGNAMRSFTGDVMILRATRAIAKDEEILMPYRLPGPVNEVTQAELQKIWGFRCDCGLCLAEAKTSVRQGRERAQLMKEATDVLSANPISDAKPPTNRVASRIEKLYVRLSATYDREVFQHMPRLALVPLSMWLCRADAQKKDWDKVAKNACETLRNLGFVVTVDESQQFVAIERQQCLLVDDAIDAALLAGRAYEGLGKLELAKQMTSFSKELYEVLNGDVKSFDERLSQA